MVPQIGPPRGQISPWSAPRPLLGKPRCRNRRPFARKGRIPPLNSVFCLNVLAVAPRTQQTSNALFLVDWRRSEFFLALFFEQRLSTSGAARTGKNGLPLRGATAGTFPQRCHPLATSHAQSPAPKASRRIVVGLAGPAVPLSIDRRRGPASPASNPWGITAIQLPLRETALGVPPIFGGCLPGALCSFVRNLMAPRVPGLSWPLKFSDGRRPSAEMQGLWREIAPGIGRRIATEFFSEVREGKPPWVAV